MRWPIEYRAQGRLRRPRRPARHRRFQTRPRRTPTRSSSAPASRRFRSFSTISEPARPLRRYVSTSGRTLERLPPIRRDLISRRSYLVPNSIVVTRGCPQHCDFCYKDAFFEGGRSFYTQRVDDALAEIDRLPGRHLYFLDDHLFGDRRFAAALFEGMRGMGRLFQGAATVDSVLRGDLVERAAEAGLRSLFVGFETLAPGNLVRATSARTSGATTPPSRSGCTTSAS